MRGDALLLAYAWLLFWGFAGPCWLMYLTYRMFRRPRTIKKTDG
jgi:hypothetical protein